MQDRALTEPHGTPPAPIEPAPHRRHGCLTALMVLFGLVLMLPGLCVAITAVTTLPSVILVGVGNVTGQRPSDPYFWLIIGGWAVFWLICLVIGWLGVKLIRNASR